MSNNLIKLEEQVQKSLIAIINSPIASGLKTKQLQEIFEKQINILGYLVKTNKSKDKQLTDIIEKYNAISNRNFTIDTKTSYEDNDVLADDINYLAIYIRNIYKIDLDALVSGKKADIVQSSVSEVQQKDRGFANKFGSFAMPGFGASEGLPNESNPYFISLANMRLNDEIRKGNVYAFKTKPKIIPILKYLIVVFSLLATLSCILVGVGMILCKDTISLVGNDSGNATWMGSFYLIFTICLGMITYTILRPMTIVTLNKKKNENYLYYFRWQNVVVSLGFFVVFVLISLSQPTSAFSIFKHMPDDGNSWLWFIGVIMLIVGLAGLIGFTIITALLNPKSDRERMENIIKQYIEEISSGKVPPPSFV